MRLAFWKKKPVWERITEWFTDHWLTFAAIGLGVVAWYIFRRSVNAPPAVKK